MNALIARIWKRFLHLLLKRIILVLTLLFCAGVGLALANMSRLSSNLVTSQATQTASLYVQSFQQVIDLYSLAAAERAKTVDGITVTHAYLNTPGAIPLPSTFAIEMADQISEKNPEMKVRMYSDYPFPWRKNGGAQDDFEGSAIDYLKQNPNKPYSRLETKNGHTVMRYGEAMIMRQSCVACHNTRTDSPKRDWEVGDVGGVWEISRPLDPFVDQIQRNLKETFTMLGGISVLGLSGLTLVMGKLRQTTKDLEVRVKERTTDLAQANVDLEKRNGLIRQIFGRYLSDTIVNTLLDNPEGLQLGGDRRKVTILTSDLRGFTALAERLQPEEVIHILNLYLDYMADVINRYGGTIDEFMGDGILVLFGAPIARDDDATRAVACACAMQLAMGSVNETMKVLGLPQLEMGIGINTGEVVVGNIGSEKRTKYGIVGSQVNLTYRIESYTKGGQILISEQTLREAGSSVRITRKLQVQPKGYNRPLLLYEVYGISGFYNLYLPKEDDLLLPLPAAIPLQYTILQDKHIDPTIAKGSLVKLSTKGAEIRVEPSAADLPVELTNLKLNLHRSDLMETPQTAALSEDIYAKVLERWSDRASFYIHFTAMPPALQTQLDALYQSIAQDVATSPVHLS